MFFKRVILGGLPSAMALKRIHIWNGTCFFFTMVHEDAKHRFITCSVVKAIWVVISQIWTSITRSILSHFKWAFIDDDKVIPAHHIRSCLTTLGIRGCGLIGQL